MAEGIPVVYFVPPVWPQRVGECRKMRRLMTHVLSALPFEHDWLSERGVPSTYVGHPYFDELAGPAIGRRISGPGTERAKTGRVVGILPGSRNQEVDAQHPGNRPGGRA